MSSNSEEDHDASSKDSFLSQQVTTAWSDAILIVGCFATGLLDSAVFNVWSCFVSMQTGNTVYVGLGVTQQPASQPWRWAKSLTSILCFIGGSFIFGRLMRWGGPTRRSTLLLAVVAQAVLCFVAAILSTLQVIPRDAGDRLPEDFRVLIPVAMLAAQAGGQCVLSRVLGYGEIPTVVLTSAYCDLAMDPDVFSGPTANSKRNRRIASMFVIVLGAILGGAVTRNGDIALALWLTCGVKSVMALAWLFWREKRLQLE